MGTTPSPSSLPPPTPTGPADTSCPSGPPLPSGLPASPGAPGSSGLTLKPGTAWADAWRRCREAAPEAFTGDGLIRGLRYGGWHDGGQVPAVTSPLDGTPIAGPPAPSAAAARDAVSAARDQHRAWRHIPQPERCARVAAALDALTEHRTLLALLQVWESGLPWKQAQADADLAIDAVRRYVDGAAEAAGEAERAGTERAGTERAAPPLPGPLGEVAPRQQPMGALLETVLVQALAGNAVVAVTADDGPAASTSLACALALREGLPVTLLAGRCAREAVTEAVADGRCFSAVPRSEGAARGVRPPRSSRRSRLLGGVGLFGLGGVRALRRPYPQGRRVAPPGGLLALRSAARSPRRLPRRVSARAPLGPLRTSAGRRVPRRPLAGAGLGAAGRRRVGGAGARAHPAGGRRGSRAASPGLPG
ncbi:aldehyde dehydrogenase family protein [Streptomyces sp. M600PL45_2]|uniref:Aldehyde dehydrogenase family protein n=1 Tax=Streptomyces marispadix TaxID=2922868 RepID=A0ABS9T4R6_9ACTN|nr:aldehyde dehydrogenase family protein [Streptomyces marispadix]MCH6163500.1 aldehyde dehydrogenase family protein [Streptomyces marispadix]